MRKKFWAFGGMMFFATLLMGQFNLGVQFCYLNAFDENNDGHAGGGLKLEYTAKEDVAVTGGFSYYSTATYQTEYIAQAVNLYTRPQEYALQLKNEVSVMHFYLGAKKYLVGQHHTFKKYSSGSVYVEGQIGAILANYRSTTEYTTAITDQYYVDITDSNLGSILDYNLSAGLGAEKKIAGFFLFGQAMGNVKLYQRSYTTIRLDIPFSFGFNVGIRIPLGEDYM